MNITYPLHVVILAAGQGTRMKSGLPKILHPLGERPLFHYALDLAHKMTPTKVILVVSPSLKDLKCPFPADLVIQHPAEGTGDAVKQALPCISTREGYVLILYADTPLIQEDTLSRVFAHSSSHPDLAVILLGMRPPHPEGYGRILVNGTGEVEDIIEQKDLTPSQEAIDLCNSGVMLVRADLLEDLLSKLAPHNAAKEYYLPDIVKIARQKGFRCGVVEGKAKEFMGVNTQQDLAHAEAALQDRWRDQAMTAGVILKDPRSVYFSYDTKIAPGAIVHPHVVFGPEVEIGSGAEIFPFCKLSQTRIATHARIGPFAHLRGDVEVQENAEVGNFVEVKKSKFSPHAKAKHLSYVGDTEVGPHANIGAGTITCNYDGFRKSKTHIGKGAFIGSNSSLVAPLSIGDYAIVGAGSVVTRDVESQGLVIARGEQVILENGAETFRAKRTKEKDKE